MKKLFIGLLGLLTLTAFAGDGGYYSTTCLSDSQRTVVTITTYDHDKPTLNIIIDGQAKVYDSNETSHDYNAGIISSSNGDVTVGDYGTMRTLKMANFSDPRGKNRITRDQAKENLNIKLNCKKSISIDP